MNTHPSPALIRSASYCRCWTVFLDEKKRVAAVKPAQAPLKALKIKEGGLLPPRLRNLGVGEWLFLEEEWFVQGEGRDGLELLIIRPVRMADRILGPYGDDPVNEMMVKMLLDNPYEGLTTVGREGKVTFLSPTNEAWFGMERGGGIGLYLSDLSPTSRLQEVARTGDPETAQVLDLHGKTKVTLNLPVKRAGEVIGAVGRILFQNPGQVEELSGRVGAMERQLERYTTLLEEMRGKRWSFSDILAKDPEMLRLIAQGRRVADSSANILLLGESGTGKELFAQAIHQASRRKKNPFVAVNCSAIPRDLVESELFGYEEGAFSGARKKGKPGKFELATQGTLFLDEIGELPLESQGKLLRALEERMIERVGATVATAVDFRLIAATNRNLREMVARGLFRSDLYYRINEMPITIPPLRERKGDIPMLSQHFLSAACKEENLPERVLSPEALEALSSYEWPGNVRELRSAMKRAAWQAGSRIVEARDLPQWLEKPFQIGAEPPTSGSLESLVADAERAAIRAALEASGQNRVRAAKALGIHRTALYKKMAKLGL